MQLLQRCSNGLQADLTEYHELKFEHGTDSFLNIPNQNVLRSGRLARFLAHPTVDVKARVVLYDHIVEGRDLLASSRSLRGATLPASELTAFQEAIRELLEKETDKAAPKSATVIRNFRLPSPAVDPDLYRLVKVPGRTYELVVLWGCEKVPGTSLSPLDAADQLRTHLKPAWRVWVERAAVLLLVLVAGALIWQGIGGREQEENLVAQNNPLSGAQTSPERQTPPQIQMPSELSQAGKAEDQQSKQFEPEGDQLGQQGQQENEAVRRQGNRIGRMSNRPGGRSQLEQQGNLIGQQGEQTDRQAPQGGQLGQRSQPGQEEAKQTDQISNQPPQKGVRMELQGRQSNQPDGQRGNQTGQMSNQTPQQGNQTEQPGQQASQSSQQQSKQTGPMPNQSPAQGKLPGQQIPPRVRTGPSDQLEIVSESNRATNGGAIYLYAKLKGTTDAKITIHSWKVDGVLKLDGNGNRTNSRRIDVALEPGEHRIEVEATSEGKPYRAECKLTVETRTTYQLIPTNPTENP